MKAYKIYICGFFLFMLISQRAISQITASQDSGCAPVSVSFTAPPGSSNSLWDFDDGVIVPGQAPGHIFTSAGVYNVTYTGTIAGNTVRDTINIYVFEPPRAPGFTTLTPTTGCIPLTVDFQDTSSGSGGGTIVGWNWTFGDGGFDNNNDPTPSYTYTLAGVFDIILLIRDINGCEATSHLNAAYLDLVSTSPPPNAIITTPNPTSACDPPLVITFSGASSFSNSPSDTSLTYQWDFANGNTSNDVNPPQQTYSADGVYQVQLTVTDNNGCASTAVRNVVIGSPNASFIASGDVNDTVCNPVTFINNSTGANFLYDYGDGISDTANTHTYADSGVYFVKLSVSAGQCSDDTTIRIVVEEIEAGFTSVPHYSCTSPFTVMFFDSSKNAVKWQWQFGDGETDSVPNPTHNFVLNDPDPYFIYPEQTYTDQLTVTSEHGCTDTYSISNNDSLFRPTSLFTIDTAEGCVPLQVAFFDSSISFDSIVIYTYDFDDGTVVSSSDSDVVHTFTAPGDYYTYLIIQNERGCIDTSYAIHIRVGLPPNPNFSLDTNVICPNVPVQFTDLTPPGDSVDTWHYDTDMDWMSDCYTEANPSWSFSSDTGFHDVLLTAGYNGCYADTTIQDMVKVLGPIARFEANCRCDTPLVVSFTGEIKGVDTLVWNFGDGTILGTTTEYNPVHTYSASGDYIVTLTGYNNTTGCDPYVTTKGVYVRELEADFDIDSFYCAGFPYSFDASASKDVHTFCNRGYRWVFEEDVTPPIRTENSSTTYLFQTSGYHEITLVVRDINECFDTIRKTVRVFGVDAEFIADSTSGCLPLTVAFNDTSTGDTTLSSWLWSFGDFEFSSDTNPTHTYTDNDTFLAILLVTDVLGCIGADTAIITPTLPNANFLAIGTRFICTEDSVRFIPVTPGHASYEWNFGDGGDTTGYLVSHIYDSSGTYTVSLTVTDTFGCTNSSSRVNYVQVQGTPQAMFTSSVDSQAALCYPIAINYTDVSTVTPLTNLTRTWDLGTGNPTVGNPTVGEIYSLPGTYAVSLVVATSFGCKDTSIRDITVRGPRGDFDMNRNTICKGEDITFSIKNTFDVFNYTWDFGDGTDTSDITPITHEYNFHPPSGRTIAKLIIYSEGFTCPQTIEDTVFIYQVVADFNRNNEVAHVDTFHCIGTSDLFTNISQNADSWTWDLGDGTTFSNSNPPAHMYLEPDTYNVRLTVVNNTLGCPDTIIKPMIINANPVALANGGSACEDGDSVYLNASGGAFYFWTPANGLSSDSIANPGALPSSTTEYTVLVMDTNGCSDDTAVIVRIFERPDSIYVKDSIVIGDSIQLVPPMADDSDYNFIWTPDIELSCDDCPKPVARPLEDQLYTVVVEDKLGCFSVPSNFDIIVLPLTSVDVPSAFTPNADGHNDIVYVNGWGIKKLLEFKIYNRWGQLVFQTSNLENGAWNTTGWDGTYLGKLQNIDSYAYQVAVLTYVDDNVVKKEGFISLLR